MTENCIVEYNGIIFDCFGSLRKKINATIWEPAEGGYMEDFIVYVQGEEVTDLLRPEILDELNSKMYDQLCDN